MAFVLFLAHLKPCSADDARALQLGHSGIKGSDARHSRTSTGKYHHLSWLTSSADCRIGPGQDQAHLGFNFSSSFVAPPWLSLWLSAQGKARSFRIQDGGHTRSAAFSLCFILFFIRRDCALVSLAASQVFFEKSFFNFLKFFYFNRFTFHPVDSLVSFNWCVHFSNSYFKHFECLLCVLSTSLFAH